MRHCVHVYTTLRLGVVHSVYVAKPDVVNPTRSRRLYDLRFCIERTVHVAQFTGGHATHCARSYDIRLCDVRTAVSYTHLRAHETVLDLVCRLLLEKKKR